MKRSEMLLNIASEISAEYHTSFDLAQDMAEVILTRIEKEGMRPPSIPTRATGWEVGKGVPSYVNEWEQEDDRYCGAV